MNWGEYFLVSNTIYHYSELERIGYVEETNQLMQVHVQNAGAKMRNLCFLYLAYIYDEGLIMHASIGTIIWINWSKQYVQNALLE